MGKESKIAWTDNTQNWWIGCEELPGRPGCAFCYAHAQGRRCGWDAWGKDRPRMITGASNWKKPIKWDVDARLADRVERVFVMSLGDFLEDRSELVEPRKRACEIMTSTTNLEWLILTKRIDNAGLLPDGFLRACRCRLGITVENQTIADRDVPKLLALDVPNFISVEPMLGAIDMDEPRCGSCGEVSDSVGDDGATPFCSEHEEECSFGHWLDPLNGGIEWVIVGAESRGKNAGRPMSEDWVRALRDQCVDAGVPFMLKQGHRDGMIVHAPEIDGRTWMEAP